jgi:RNA polymerase sigma factor (sigma-70 family)
VTGAPLHIVSELVDLKTRELEADLASRNRIAAVTTIYVPTLPESANLRTDRQGPPSGAGGQRSSTADFALRLRRTAKTASRFKNWRKQSEKWRRLMVAAQGGECRAYDLLLRELDVWLRRYYARRLPPAAAEDARQDALLAIHTNRYTYEPSRPFGPWVAAIARYKWIDHVRDTSRHAAQSLSDKIPVDDREQTTISGIVLDDLLRHLKPAQARVIRLVKLQGVSIEDASGATGQSAALVKVNIHRGLKKLATLVASDTRVTDEPNQFMTPRSFQVEGKV